MESERIVTLAVHTYEKAQMLKSFLEVEGIECFLENMNLIQGAVSSGVQVMIKESDVEKALQLVDVLRESEFRAHLHKHGGAAKILVPVDFAPHSYQALDVAIDWAYKLNAEITILHTYFLPILSSIPFGDNFSFDINAEEMVVDLKEKAEEELKKIVLYAEERTSSKPLKKVAIKSHLTSGIAEEEIVKYSNTYRPTLIVMGTRSKDKKSNDLIGSVTAEVLDIASFPVLAIPEVFKYTQVDDFKNVLFVTNFEENDLMALEKLDEIIKPIDVNIHCVHIGNHKDGKWDDVKMKGLHEHLTRKHKESKITCSLVDTTDYWKGIEDYILEHKIDLVTSTTHRRGFLSRIMNPNLSKKMLFHTDLPLLVFHD